MVLIVSEPSISGISDMERIIKTAEIFKTKIGICINKHDINPENTKKSNNYVKIKLTIYW
jgi:MinD superfamily P-loop ATPase